MRLIDADALKGEKFYSHERHENCVSVYAIDMMPTIEPERPHGEWKTAYLDHVSFGVRPKVIYCSKCQMVVSHKEDFCEYCGSDNRKRGEEE